MRNHGWGSRIGLMALACGLVAATACSDDEDRDEPNEESVVDAGFGEERDASPGSDGQLDIDGSMEVDAGMTTDSGSEVDAATPYATLPSVLSLANGCSSAVGIPALCSVTQTDGKFSANCAGVAYTGTLGTDRAVTMTRPETTATSTAKVNLSCAGKLEHSGVLTLKCTQTTSAVGDTAASTAVCDLTSDKTILPTVSCMELPATISDVAVCKEGAANGGTTLHGGSCKVIQDACAFQAECANDITLTGSVTKTGVTFTSRLKALADAVTPAGGTPAFLKGAEVNHSCEGTIANGKLTGACTAGGTRGASGLPPTSVCANEASVPSVGTCNLLAPSKDFLFVLDSCDMLKNGEGQTPGIGQPVCALQQNNCIWNVQCGEDPLTRFSGRLTPGATKLEWRLLTGTPCEIQVSPGGAVSGSCTVAGEAPCQLRDIPAVAGGPTCPALPKDREPRSNGCAGGDPLACRGTLQHGCNQVSICQFSSRFPDLVIAGKTSYGENQRPHFEFNGAGDYRCYVDAALQSEIDSGDREANEWFGDCMNPVGGTCRNNWNPTTKTGFRSLRVYWDPAGSSAAP